MQAKFRNGGQACTAANRFLVHEKVYGPFAAALTRRVKALRVGSGSDPDTDIGPLIDTRAVAKVIGLVERAVAAGAQLLAGGQPVQRPGYFFEPSDLERRGAVRRHQAVGHRARGRSGRAAGVPGPKVRSARKPFLVGRGVT